MKAEAKKKYPHKKNAPRGRSAMPKPKKRDTGEIFGKDEPKELPKAGAEEKESDKAVSAPENVFSVGERRELSAGALLAPIPPAIVTVADGETVNALTVAWCGILATVPPKTYVSIRPTRYSHEILLRGGEFVINLPSSDMAEAVDLIGIYTGRKMNKIEAAGLHLAESKSVMPPTVKECPIAIECRVTERIEMGSHDVFMADIVNVSCQNGLIDAAGKLHYEKADLLAYAHGEYYRLGERVGRFGFSTDKEKRKARKRRQA